jgi:hypothetical protein
MRVLAGSTPCDAFEPLHVPLRLHSAGRPDLQGALGGGATPFVAPFVFNKNDDHFTKTGSGQTWGLLKTRVAFLGAGCAMHGSSYDVRLERPGCCDGGADRKRDVHPAEGCVSSTRY